MIPIAVEELAGLGLGALTGSGELRGLQIDSRRVGPGDLFVAIRGGREFVGDARERGAATLVPNDEHEAMAIIGRLLRSRSSARFVGITGSTGKTSTKDILAALCAPVARTVATERSYNAELGVPLTLGRLEPDTEVCILELAMRGFGQIAALCEIAEPDLGVITTVGPVHLELVGSVDGVARSKAELVDALPDDGIAIVPSSAELEPHLRDDIEIRRVGPVDVELRDDGAHVAFGGGRIQFPLTSRHQAQNALTALTAYDALGLPLDRLPESAASVRLSPWRGEELPLPGGGFVVNDAYNANPTSMEAALRHLAERGSGRRLLAILGGMAELGEHAEHHHREIAELAAELDIDVIAVGDLARAYAAGMWEPDAASALSAARELVRPGDAVLVKASRAVALEGIAPDLANVL
ncbi:MAG TPA: UDP-N-acetylmuramoyl-tripeptide--D-alanyl-D-alanine ligase [Gaiellaceae bacterium]|nr:UDP-N-acetylmuramoyl-tripeptide--D-alanyl-D-alanine ligase [Gaiellaceae bacterium]